MLRKSLTGLRPSPTRHAVVGFRVSGRLAQGPAVRLADRRHPLRLDVLTMTRSAYLQVRCAVVAQVGRAMLTLHPLFRGLGAKLDSILPTLSVQASQSRSGTLPGTGGPFGAVDGNLPWWLMGSVSGTAIFCPAAMTAWTASCSTPTTRCATRRAGSGCGGGGCTTGARTCWTTRT